MNTLTQKLKDFLETNAGKWTMFIVATVIAGLATHKIIEKTSKE